MAELEIDQSNLPCVREVCQCFAVLEDGALAHNLQEQEIEQYYSTNIQKNQLVQNDIRVAKRLQDEEEEQQAQQRDIFRQASKQQEEQDFEFARVIQDEIQRSAEEARRREQDDEEIAKQLQEEEEQRMRVTSRGQEGHSAGSTNEPVLQSPHQHTLSSLQGQERCSSTTTGWHYSTSYNHSDVSGTRAVPTRGQQDQKITTSRSNEGHVDSSRQFRDGLREPLSEDSEDSDTVFSEQLSLWSQRVNQRRNTAPSQRRTSFRYLQEKNYKSLYSRSSFTDELRRWKEEGEEWDEEYCDDGHYGRERGSLVNQNQERGQRDCEGWYRRRDQDRDPRMVEIKERRCSRSESVKLRDRSGHNNRDLVRTWSHNDNPDKRVHFQDDTRSLNRQPDESRRVWEMLGQVLRERGVPVTFGGNGAPLQIRPQSRDSQVLHGSEVSYGSSHQHQRDFHRAAATRHSFHGDIRKRRRSSHRENSGRDHREDQGRHCDEVEHNEEVYGISSRDWHRTDREGRGSRGWREHRYPNDDERERNPNYHKVKRTTSEHRHWHNTTEQRLRSEEQQEVERRVEWPPRRAPQRSQSLSSSSWASTRDRSRHMTAGVSLQRDSGETSLDLGELEQVLHDEELARKLQKEEEKLSSRTSQPSPRSSYPEGDFRVAQVAQDEEIARFMQKQEMKSKRRSRDLEGPASWREHRAMMSHHDRRAARERQVQRERLDSEGLPSTTEDCCPENQPPSPHSTYPQSQLIRNIAEELDPTFQARRQDTERLQVDQTDPGCQSLPIPQSGVNDLLVEHAFIPPTKRQPEKSGRTKPKEKKENCKQQ